VEVRIQCRRIPGNVDTAQSVCVGGSVDMRGGGDGGGSDRLYYRYSCGCG